MILSRYCGFVLGLLVELQGRYTIISNRDERKASCACFDRYDVVLEAKSKENAIILEFKVHDPGDEDTLKDTVQAALLQIEEKQYAERLLASDIPEERIRRYGFVFERKKVLIG